MSNLFQTRQINAKTLQNVAQQNKIPITSLIVLDQKIDPFFTLSGKAKPKKAKWITRFWKDMGSPTIHQRGIHYALMGESHLPHSGKIYEGIASDQNYGIVALEHARYQELIPYEKIKDYRTTFHQKFRMYDHENINELVDFKIDFKWIEERILDRFYAIWYPYPQQDVICECWSEKRSILEVIMPILNRYNCNYIEGDGDISLTRCYEFTSRVIDYYHRLGIKKFRVFYISDFDPVGRSIPISMARKVEFLIYRILNMLGISFLEIDIRIESIAVTPEQVSGLKLKTVPIPKEKTTRSDGKKASYATRKRKFYRIFKVNGVVELESLVDKSPDEVSRIMEDRLSRFYDTSVDIWIDKEMKRVRKIIRIIMAHADWTKFVEEGELKVDWSPLVEYVEAVEPPKANHNEYYDWGLFWLLESQLDYAQQLYRYSLFRLNKGDKYHKEQYSGKPIPEQSHTIEGHSITDEDFETKFIPYVIRKQQELRDSLA